jgi:hypothetical protein
MVLRSLSGAQGASIRAKIEALVKYVESIQERRARNGGGAMAIAP